jgi:hypothetical protein
VRVSSSVIVLSELLTRRLVRFPLAQRNQFDAADEVLRHVLQSNAYQARGPQNTLRLALNGACLQIVDYQCPLTLRTACAVVAKQHSIAVE